jgi:hypothetical protein
LDSAVEAFARRVLATSESRLEIVDREIDVVGVSGEIESVAILAKCCGQW